MQTSRHLIFHTPFGSHLYGTETPTSDHDFKGVALPTDLEILSLTDFGTETHGSKSSGVGRRNTSADTDHEVYSLAKFVKLLAQGQVMALDVLFAFPAAQRRGEHWPIFKRLFEGREHFLTKDTATFAGYCMQQAAKYGLVGSRCRAALDAVEILEQIGDFAGTGVRLWELVGSHEPRAVEAWMREKGFDMEHCSVEADGAAERHGNALIKILDKRFPVGARLRDILPPIRQVAAKYGPRVREAMQNEGVDWKALSHALRVCLEAQELLRTGFITFPLKPRDRALVMQVKQATLPIEGALALVREHLDLLAITKARSTLRDEVDTEWMTAFVQREHLNVVRGLAIQ